MQRILVKMDCNENGCYIKTVSRNVRSRQRFYIPREQAAEAEKNGSWIVQDGSSFARICILEDRINGKYVKIHFFWASFSESDYYNGRKEQISLPYETFQKAFVGEELHMKVLSLKEKHLPKIVFESRKNLKKVVKHPHLRRKLGKFLSRNFQWENSTRIEIYDDFVPYSFGFCECREHGYGIVGGIILHGQEDLRTAEYGMHT